MQGSIKLSDCYTQAVDVLKDVMQIIEFPEHKIISTESENMFLTMDDGGEYEYRVGYVIGLNGGDLDVSLSLFSEFPFTAEQHFELRIAVEEVGRVFVDDYSCREVCAILATENMRKSRAKSLIYNIKGT